MFMNVPFKLKMNKYRIGHIAEILCRIYMFFHGYKVIAHNYKSGTGKKNSCGEIDFIVQKRKTIVFCEVKQRKDRSAFLFALTRQQQKRIMNGAQFFMKTHPQYTSFSMRFDVFFVQFPYKIKHIKNALYSDNSF